MPYLKLMKMLYLADKESYNRFGESMSGDCPVSMPHGPVLSQAYDLIKDGGKADDLGWNHWIKGEADYQVSLRHECDRDGFDELTDNDIDILDFILGKFGHMGAWKLVDYTHEHCSEWVDPQGSSRPIKIEAILRDLGKSEEQIRAILDHTTAIKQLDQVRNLLR